MKLLSYRCESKKCGEKFVLFDTYASYCVSCGSPVVKTSESSNDRYSLIDNKIQMIVVE